MRVKAAHDPYYAGNVYRAFAIKQQGFTRYVVGPKIFFGHRFGKDDIKWARQRRVRIAFYKWEE